MQIRDRIVELRRVRAGDLAPNPRNWRTHPKAQQEALRGVLSEVGYASALVARLGPDGGLILIDGHLRAETTPDQEVPVLVLDVDEAEADKLLLSMDPLSAMAGRNDALLKELIEGASVQDDALRRLLEDLMPSIPNPGLADPEVAPPVPENPTAESGDLFVMGSHRLLCGDATSAADVGRLLDGTTPFMMVTDPPYGVDYDPEWRKEAGINNSDRMGAVRNDHRSDWSEAWNLFRGDVAYVWHGALHSSDVARGLLAAGLEVRAQIVWQKGRFAIGRGHYHWGHEPCWYVVRHGRTARWKGDRKQSTVWQIESVGTTGSSEEATFHSTQKPIEAMRRPIANHGRAADAVYDPFCGSGTTVIACEQLGRACFAMEIDRAYCDVIVSRWETFTGRKAERIPA